MFIMNSFDPSNQVEEEIVNKYVRVTKVNQASTVASTSNLTSIPFQSTRRRSKRITIEEDEVCHCCSRNNTHRLKKLSFRAAGLLLATTLPTLIRSEPLIPYSKRSRKQRAVSDNLSPSLPSPLLSVPPPIQIPTPPKTEIYWKRADYAEEYKNAVNGSTSTNSTHSTNSTSSTNSTITASSTNTTAVVIPDGWIPPSRPTSYYPVPVIIALSVLVSLMLAGTIVGAVLLKRSRRNRKSSKHGKERGEDEKGFNEKSGGGGMKALVAKMKKKGGKGRGKGKKCSGAGTAIAVGIGSIRRRRGTNSSNPAPVVESHSAQNEEVIPVVGLFATISRNSQQYIRPSSPAPSIMNYSRPTTPRPSSIRSINNSDHLQRTSSRPDSVISLSDSLHSLHNMQHLPAPGPPAYRPNSSRIQRIVRATESIFPLSSSSSSSSGPILPMTSSDIVAEEWHWPNEKGIVPVASSSSSNFPSTSTTSLPPPPPPSTASSLIPIDRSQFVAHVATDDKATLARLRELAQTTSYSPEDRLEASAPHFDLEEKDYDDEGFERFVPEEDEEEEIEVEAIVGSLPLPPRPIITSFTYSQELPTYGEENTRRRVIQEPTAPPQEDDGDWRDE